MAVFDELVSDVETRFDLNGKAPAVLSTLLTLITDEKRGGLFGFLDLFRRAGLGMVSDSWVSVGADTPLSNQQLEDALGRETLNQISSRVGLPPAKTSLALAYMIPATIAALTSNGSFPTAQNLNALAGKYLEDKPSAASSASPAVAPNLSNASSHDHSLESVAADGVEDNSLLRFILPLLILGLLVFLSFRFCNATSRDVNLTNVNNVPASRNLRTTQNTNTATPGPVTQSH